MGYEGNNTSCNSFSALSNDEIVDRSISMGVVIDKSSFDIIDMLTELEKARQCLCDKALNNTANMIKTDNDDINLDEVDSEKEN